MPWAKGFVFLVGASTTKGVWAFLRPTLVFHRFPRKKLLLFDDVAVAVVDAIYKPKS